MFITEISQNSPKKMKICDIAVFLKKYRHYGKTNATFVICMSKLVKKHIKLNINKNLLHSVIIITIYLHYFDSYFPKNSWRDC